MTTFQFLSIWLVLLIGSLCFPGCGGENQTAPFSKPDATRFEGCYTVTMTVQTRAWAYNQQQADRMMRGWIENDVSTTNEVITISNLSIEPAEPEKVEVEP